MLTLNKIFVKKYNLTLGEVLNIYGYGVDHNWPENYPDLDKNHIYKDFLRKKKYKFKWLDKVILEYFD